jgi:GxxExxY protein
MRSPEQLNDLTRRTIGAAMKVHSKLGPGLLESAYQVCLAFELRRAGLAVATELPISLIYENEVQVAVAYRADMLVEQEVIVELKAVDRLIDTHEAQLLTHLRIGGFRVGLLMNFNEPHLRDGIRRRVNSF